MIECTSVYGYKVLLAKEKLVFRPAVYGIIVHSGKALLIRSRHSGKYALPGGGVEIGEKLTAALSREVQEETGIAIEVGRFAHFQEDFFYYDPKDEAFHSFLVYYFCMPQTFHLLADDQVDDEDAETPRWIEIAALQAPDFQSHGAVVLGLLQSAAANQ